MGGKKMDYNKLLRQTVNNLGGGEDVIKDMQTRINKQSYTPIKEDGIWGEETQRAVNMLDDVTLQSINNRMIEDRVLKLNDEGNTDRATYQKYLSTHTTKSPKMDLNDKLNQGVRENKTEYREIKNKFMENLIKNPYELIEDVQTAMQYNREMKSVGRKLVKKYGKGAAGGIDNYYHALLQCELAQKGENNGINGLMLGLAKEFMYDKPRKSDSLFGNLTDEELLLDINKDLNNNYYGHIMGKYNKNKKCANLLNDLRTQRMIDENIR